MIEKINKNTLLILLSLSFLIFGCGPTQEEKASRKKEIERADHQKCVEQGIDFDEESTISNELYWRCRYNLLKDKLVQYTISPKIMENNALIRELMQKAELNLNKNYQSNLTKIQDDVDQIDHSKCVLLGFTIDSKDQSKNKDYYECRKKLLNDRINENPKLAQIYKNNPLNSDNLDKYNSQSLKTRLDRSINQITRNMIEKYPNCIGVDVQSKNFTKCAKAQDKSAQCLAQIEPLAQKKEMDNKMYCQQQSFIQFPDDYLVQSGKSVKEIERMMKEEQEAEAKRIQEQMEKQITRTKTLFEQGFVSRDTMSKDQDNKEIPEIKKKEIRRQKMRILDLREEFVKKCDQLMKDKMPFFIEDETQKCKDIARDWDKEEEI